MSLFIKEETSSSLKFIEQNWQFHTLMAFFSYSNVITPMEDLHLVLPALCTEFVCPAYWHTDIGATSKVDDVHIEHGLLPYVLPLTVHLIFFWVDN